MYLYNDFIICLGPILTIFFPKEKIKHNVIARCKFIKHSWRETFVLQRERLSPSFLALVKHYSSILQKGNSALNFKATKHLTWFL